MQTTIPPFATSTFGGISVVTSKEGTAGLVERYVDIVSIVADDFIVFTRVSTPFGADKSRTQ